MANREQYRQQALDLLPPGRIWNREPGSAMATLFLALSGEWERTESRVLDALENTDPRTVIELLSAWELAYGLPGDCATLAATSVLRRLALTGAVTAQGGQTPGYYIEVAAALGWPVEVEEEELFRVDQDGIGAPVATDSWQWAWRIHAPEFAPVFVTSGAGATGQPLQTSDSDSLECTLFDLMPAHTVLEFVYDLPATSSYAPWENFGGGTALLSVTPLDAQAFVGSEPMTSAGTFFGGRVGQLGMNTNFWNRFEDMSMGYTGNLRYMAEAARGYFGSQVGTDITFDENGFPRLEAGTLAVLWMFKDMGVPGLYLDGEVPKRLAKAYRPGRYWFEVGTEDPANNPDPLFVVAGDAGFVRTLVTEQAPGQRAVYYVDVPDSARSDVGLEVVIQANATTATQFLDFLFYHEDERLLGVQGTHYWAPDMLQQLAQNERLRHMEIFGENETGAHTTTLADVPSNSDATWHGVGPSLEALIALHNEAKIDLQLTIPSGLGLDFEFHRNRAQLCFDLLDPRLRVLPNYSNEVWLSTETALHVQNVIAPQLGFPANFTGRIDAQAYCQNLIHKAFREVFTGEHADRFVAVCESQIGATTTHGQLLNFEFEGETMGQRGVSFQVAPYLYPNAGDFFPWYLWTPGVNDATFFADLWDYWEGTAQAAFASFRITCEYIRDNFPNCYVETYESLFQEGLLFIPAPTWTPTLVQGLIDQNAFFVGLPVLYEPPGQGFPTYHLAKLAHFTTPQITPGTFVPEEWENTLAKPASDYTVVEEERTLLAFGITKSQDRFRELIEFGVQELRAIIADTTGGEACVTCYKYLSKPGLQAGFRAMGAERNEPGQQAVGFEFAGSWAPQTAWRNLSNRPNGEVPS